MPRCCCPTGAVRLVWPAPAAIPESIRTLPARVMATPMGSAFANMFEGAANGMGADPLRGAAAISANGMPAMGGPVASGLGAQHAVAAPSPTPAPAPTPTSAPPPTPALPPTPMPLGRAGLAHPTPVPTPGPKAAPTPATMAALQAPLTAPRNPRTARRESQAGSAAGSAGSAADARANSAAPTAAPTPSHASALRHASVADTPLAPKRLPMVPPTPAATPGATPAATPGATPGAKAAATPVDAPSAPTPAAAHGGGAGGGGGGGAGEGASARTPGTAAPPGATPFTATVAATASDTPATAAAVAITLHATPAARPAPPGGGDAAAPHSGGVLLVTPTVAPARPLLYPSRQPLTSTSGPTAGVLKLILAALAPPAASASASAAAAVAAPPLPADVAARFTARLSSAIDDPNLITASTAALLASAFDTLLAHWPPTDQKHFATLYLTRLLAARSDPLCAALLDCGLPTRLLSAGGVLDPAALSPSAARGARLMALATLSNVASRDEGARRLLEGASGALVVAAAASALSDGAADSAVWQMGGALGHNLALHLKSSAADGGGGLAAAEEWAPPLLAAAIGAVGKFAAAKDGEALGRALSVIGFVLAAGLAELAAVALSLDAQQALAAVAEAASSLGHGPLLHDVRALLPAELS